jgi:hypothetical protein
MGLAMLALLAACSSVGPPHAPEVVVCMGPVMTTNVSEVRVGDVVVVAGAHYDCAVTTSNPGRIGAFERVQVELTPPTGAIIHLGTVHPVDGAWTLEFTVPKSVTSGHATIETIDPARSTEITIIG